jgi:hypothetical protein
MVMVKPRTRIIAIYLPPLASGTTRLQSEALLSCRDNRNWSTGPRRGIYCLGYLPEDASLQLRHVLSENVKRRGRGLRVKDILHPPCQPAALP